MFIDQVIIDVIAGRGGDGCVSFRREKYVPRGGPDGGDGGKGGDVVIEANARLATLVDLHNRRLYKATRGGHGQGASRTGKGGGDVVIQVPPGTIIRDQRSGDLIGELLEAGQRITVAKGGKGGRGNERFKSGRNRAPRKATEGRRGESRRLELTLKLIADVGLVGEPNAGKSTLLSVVSAAHPEIAPYPFTTKSPVLGIVKYDEFESFVMVDIPGLIEGAHAGKGMGKEFLRHVERCRVLLYLVDVTSGDVAERYESLKSEILRYDPKLLEKPSVLALTKCDLLAGGAASVAEELRRLHATVCPISAVSGEGISRLLSALVERVR